MSDWHEPFQVGDVVYQSANGILLCADVEKTLPLFPAGLIESTITDPPYDLDKSTQNKFHGLIRERTRGTVLVFSPPENQWVLPADQYLFWIKPISTKNTTKSYSRFVEMIFLYGQGKWNSGRHWSQYTNVFNDLVEGETKHPHEKPLSLLKRLILNHTNRGDIILDPFAGSGTILFAAQQLGRRFIGIEIDPQFCEISKQRLAQGILL